MKISNKTFLLIIILVCLAVLVFNIFYMREGMDNALTILNQDTKGSCSYNEQGVKDLNSDDGISLMGFNDSAISENYKQMCKDQTNQVMCERTHYPNHTGKHVINYCNWELGE